MPFSTLSFSVLLFFLALVRHAHSSGVTFTEPGGGTTWPPGAHTISWTDGGGSPDMANLVFYTLELVVGGNSPSNSEVLVTLANGSVATGQVQGNFNASIASSVENGFYLQMTTNTTDGSQFITYSDRFTLINMKGTTPQVYLDGANSVAGTSNVPTEQLIENTTPTSSSSSTSTKASATATVTQSSSPQHSGQDSPGGGGPSTTTKIGLAIGGLFAAIGAVSIFLWMRLLWKKRRQRKEKERERQARRRTAALMEFKAELPAENHPVLISRPSELSPDSERFEAGQTERAIEIFELEGNHTHIHEAGSGRRSKAYEPSLHEAGSGRRSRTYDPTL